MTAGIAGQQQARSQCRRAGLYTAAGSAAATAVQVAGRQLTCQVRGPIDGLLSVLAAGHPETLLSREPSLEELFLSIYDEQECMNNGARRD